MTPAALRSLLGTLPGSWPPVSEPALLLRALEDAADRDPVDRRLAEAVRHAHDLATVDADLPVLIGGVRRDALVRWDPWTTTWTGSDVATGAPVMFRVLKPALARDPVARRALRRDARALGRVDGDLRWVEHPIPGLRRPLPGAPVDPRTGEAPDAGTLIRLLGTGLAALWRWERGGLRTPGLSGPEWRRVDGALRIACLTPGREADAPRDDVRALAIALSAWWGDAGSHALEAELAGLATWPPDTVEEAAVLFRRALATALARTRHHIVRARSVLQVRSEHHRLLGVLQRLQRAVPPPEGLGAVGVDLDGRVRSIRSAGGHVVWGVHGEPGETIRDPSGRLCPVQARRLLRARAAAPPNPRLQRQIGGDEAFTEAICRWVSSAHHLRTLILLVRKAGAATA